MCRKKEKEQCRNRTHEKEDVQKKILLEKKCGNRTSGIRDVRVEDMLIKKKYRRKRCWSIA